jgi:choline dehydrogenase-like flavoprotein
VIVKDGRAAGIEGRLLGGELGAPSHRFRVRAPIVIAACGTIHTPLVLEAAGVGRRSGLLGKQITLHPAARVVARFDDRLNGWDGALQSCFSDHFADDGIKLTGVYTAVNVLAAGMPGVGKSLRANAEALPYCGVFGTMVHDEGGGTVRRGPGREPVVTYSMIPRDIARLRRGIRILSEAAFAGGAREVYSPIFGQRPIRTVDEALALEKAPLDARRIECMAFHPLGSARAANDPRRGVVDQRGECFELPGLFVADGSVLPTSIGVNSQVAVLSTATKIAWSIRDRARTLSAPARLGW